MIALWAMSTPQTPLRCDYFEKALCKSCIRLADSQPERPASLEAFIEAFPDAPTPLAPRTPRRIWGSRTRAKIFVSGSVEKPVFGFPDKRGQGQDVPSCPLHHPKINQCLSVLGPLLKEYKIPPYLVNERRGELKMLLAHCNESGTELMLRFVVRSSESLPRLKKLYTALQKRLPELTVMTAHLHPTPHTFIESSEDKVLSPSSSIAQDYSSFCLNYFPGAFSQVTPEMALELYTYVAGKVQTLHIKNMLDLYSGVGAFSLFCLPFISHSTAVEIAPASQRGLAKTLADLQCQKITPIQKDVQAYLCSSPHSGFDLILANPPRKGMGPQVCHEILKQGAPHLIYSSCDLESLIRDLEILQAKYQILETQPFDMFPLTLHQEIVVHLKRKSP